MKAYFSWLLAMSLFIMCPRTKQNGLISSPMIGCFLMTHEGQYKNSSHEQKKERKRKVRELVRFYSRNHQERNQTRWTERVLKCKNKTKPKWGKKKLNIRGVEKDGTNVAEKSVSTLMCHTVRILSNPEYLLISGLLPF